MNMNIRGKALLFICAAGVSTSLLLGSLFFLGMAESEKLLDRHVEELAGHVTQEAEKFAEEEMLARMEAVALQKAYYVEIFLQEMQGDVEILAESMTKIAQEKNALSPARVYDPRQEEIHSGQLYFLAGAAGGSPSPKVWQSANIGEVMHRLARSYEVDALQLYVGTREGWCLRMNYMADSKADIGLPEKAVTPAYDARERFWYQCGKAAVAKEKPMYIPLYEDLGGKSQIACVMPYEDDAGFAGVVGISIPPVALQRELQKEGVADENICFIINAQGQIVLSTAKEGTFAPNRPSFDLRKTDNQELAQATADMLAGNNDSRRVQVDGNECYLVYARIGDMGWSYGELVRIEEVRLTAQHTGSMTQKELQELQGMALPLLEKIRFYLYCATGLMLLVLFLVSWRWAKNFTQPFVELSEGVRRVASGHFGEKIHISTGDEIEKLADSFNDMTEELKVYMQELSQAQSKKAQATAGLDVARGIQKGLLPRAFPKSEKFSLGARMEPAKEVGGDFYDFYYLDEHRLALIMAVVEGNVNGMGKGIPAALFMAVAKNILRNCLYTNQEKNPAPALKRAMERLAEENVENLAVKVFMGILDISTGELSYANTAPNPPLLCHGEVIEELSAGEVMGQGKMVLAGGDVLFLHTCDGLQDIADDSWFNKAFKPIAGEPVETIALTMEKAMKSYQQQSGQERDIALLVLRWNS